MTSDFDWPALTSSEQARALREMLADAWDEGFDAGERDVFEHVTFDEPCVKNPYRGA